MACSWPRQLLRVIPKWHQGHHGLCYTPSKSRLRAPDYLSSRGIGGSGSVRGLFRGTHFWGVGGLGSSRPPAKGCSIIVLMPVPSKKTLDRSYLGTIFSSISGEKK